jgi:hypothetical protein
MGSRPAAPAASTESDASPAAFGPGRTQPPPSSLHSSTVTVVAPVIAVSTSTTLVCSRSNSVSLLRAWEAFSTASRSIASDETPRMLPPGWTAPDGCPLERRKGYCSRSCRTFATAPQRAYASRAAASSDRPACSCPWER